MRTKSRGRIIAWLLAMLIICSCAVAGGTAEEVEIPSASEQAEEVASSTDISLGVPGLRPMYARVASLNSIMATSNILVESVSVTGKTTMKAGESDYPVCTVLPETATDKTVAWSSVNPAVATVNSAGVVYAVSAGETLIYARANDGSGKFAYYLLTVTPAYEDVDRVTKVAIYGKAEMKIGEVYAIAYEVWPATAANKGMSFESSNTSVATVDGYGRVTAVGAGSAVIIAKSADNPAILDSYELTVAAVIPVTTINVSGKAEMAVGETHNFAYEVLPSDASNKTITWSSSNTAVATINDKGQVTAVAGGTTVIRATSQADTNVYGAFLVNVKSVPITWIALSAKTQMVYSERDNVGYTIYPNDATNKRLSWTSSNPSVATVDNNGVVTASRNTAGTTVITASATDGSGVKASYTLAVSKTAVSVQSIAVSGRTVLGVGETIQANATVLPANAYNQTLYWVSDNPTVANVDQSGKVTAYSAGTALISAIATDGTLVRGGYTVAVKNSIVKVNAVTASGATKLYPKAVSYSSYSVLPANADDKRVIWTSSMPAVATVDASTGVVTAIKEGTTLITATAADGSGAAGSYIVTVAASQTFVSKVAVYGKPTMGIGDVQYMAYEIWPADASVLSVKWSSSNSNIATVSEYGVVTAKATGMVTITATAADGSGQKASYIINVQAVKVPVTRLAIYGRGSMNIGEVDYLAYEAWPTNAVDKTVSYSSSNSSVATVSEYGVVTAKTAGITVITATAKDGSGVTASYTLTVQNKTAVPVTKVAVYGKGNLMIGEIEYLAYEIWPVNATNTGVTYTTSNANVATVNSYGMVTTKSIGTATITATAADGSGIKATYTVTVTPVAQMVTKLAIYGKGTLGIGDVEYLAYEAWPADAVNKSVTYSTNNQRVATVTEYGVVTGKSAGTATITATAADGSGVKATYVVVVGGAPQKVTKLAVYGRGTLNAGEVEYLSYEAWPADAANKSVSYASSNSNVATVSEYGVVTAKNEGTVIITATAKDGSGTKATYTLTVISNVKKVTAVGVYGRGNMNVGDVEYLAYEIWPADATNKGVSYSSSNPSVATVSAYGVVTAIAPGAATITATAADGSGVQGFYTVNVQ